MEPDTNSPSATTIVSGDFEGPVSLLRSAWSLFKANWKLLALITVTPSVLTLGGTLLSSIGGAMIVVGIIISIVGIIFSIAMAPAMLDTISKLSSGQPRGTLKWWSQYKFGFGYFWVVLGLGILQLLIILGSGVLLIIPAIIVGVFSTFYIYARVLDGKKGFTSFEESYSLVKGRWWKVFGRLLAFILVYIVIAIIISLINLLAAAIFGANSIVSILIILILNLILTASIGSVALIYFYRMYQSLKATRSVMRETGTFKKWLYAFIVIGVIVIILIPITGVFAVLRGFRDYRNYPTDFNATINSNLNGSDYFPNNQFPTTTPQ